MARITTPFLLLPALLIGCGESIVDLDSDGFPETVDCDDGNASAYPGAEEVCDELDNDCDGEVDNDPTDGQTWHYDGDGDGYGSASYPTISTCDFTAPSGYVDNSDDCNDASAAASPEGVEVCDGIDNNCNDSVDDFALDPSLWYFDFDGDGYGDPSTSQQLCDPPSGWVDNGTDCDDTDADINPGQEWYVDADQDGYGNPDYRLAACGDQDGFSADNTDCDDGNADINPGTDEICDEIDNNCDEEIDEDTATDATIWYADSDEDGYGDEDSAAISCEQPSTLISTGGDCNDEDADINPSVADWCDDSIDNDCNGDIDLNCAISAAQATTRISGENAYDYLGTAVSADGDFNGDGITDLIVGAHLNSDGASSAGKAYLMLGPISAGDHDIADAALTLTGSEATNYTGFKVALDGDVDDDGYDDALISAYLADINSNTNIGKAYLMYGPTTGDFEADDADALITGSDTQNYTGQHQLGVAGDLNEDGYGDVYVGAIYYDGSNTYAGMLAAFYGPLSGTMDLEDADVQITGTTNYRYVGYASDFVDIDGDGTLDALFSEPSANTAYGVLGPLSGSLTASDASISIASTDNDFTGGQLHTGDLDGDGHLDLAITAHLDDSYLSNAGQVSVIYGPISGSITTDKAAFSVHGHGENSYLGGSSYALTVADLDDDGLDDIFIGEPSNDVAAENAGAGYLFYGPVSGTGSTAFSSADLLILGETTADALGWGSEVADIDNDGTMDLVFTARGGDSYYGLVYAMPFSAL